MSVTVWLALVITLAAMWVYAAVQWVHWRVEAAEWKARADFREQVIDRLYEDRRRERYAARGSADLRRTPWETQ